MNDHNLDDLIIDDISSNSSKTKSFLTIIALAIVVLIVAIILTKIILKDPNERAILEEDTTLISPELTLQKSDLSLHGVSAIAKKPTPVVVSKPIVEKQKKQENQEEIETIVAVDEKSDADTSSQKAEQEKYFREKVEREKRLKERAINEKAIEAKRKKEEALQEKQAKAKAAAAQERSIQELKAKKEKHPPKTKKAQKVAPKPVVKAAAKPVAKPSGHYFIQVGAFTKTPSRRFLSSITKNGFTYHVTKANSSGTKKLLLGPYNTKKLAYKAIPSVKAHINKHAFIIRK